MFHTYLKGEKVDGMVPQCADPKHMHSSDGPTALLICPLRVLMVGRVFGGVATSLLFSAFESWIVAEHFSKGLEEKWLGDTFSKAVFLGNGLVAILAGLVANFLVSSPRLCPKQPGPGCHPGGTRPSWHLSQTSWYIPHNTSVRQ